MWASWSSRRPAVASFSHRMNVGTPVSLNLGSTLKGWLWFLQVGLSPTYARRSTTSADVAPSFSSFSFITGSAATQSGHQLRFVEGSLSAKKSRNFTGEVSDLSFSSKSETVASTIFRGIFPFVHGSQRRKMDGIGPSSDGPVYIATDRKRARVGLKDFVWSMRGRGGSNGSCGWRLSTH